MITLTSHTDRILMFYYVTVRFQMLHFENNEKSLCSSSGVESQAAKRQKLDGGHLRKVYNFY